MSCTIVQIATCPGRIDTWCLDERNQGTYTSFCVLHTSFYCGDTSNFYFIHTGTWITMSGLLLSLLSLTALSFSHVQGSLSKNILHDLGKLFSIYSKTCHLSKLPILTYNAFINTLTNLTTYYRRTAAHFCISWAWWLKSDAWLLNGKRKCKHTFNLSTGR